MPKKSDQPKRRFTVWPFLIGRAVRQPIQVVVAPRPLCDAHVYGVLHELTDVGNDMSLVGDVYYREWERAVDSAILLSVVFQYVSATEQFSGGVSDRPLLDQGGRPIRLVEGFALAKPLSALNVPRQVLLAVHNQMMARYRAFWEYKIDRPFEVEPSDPLRINIPIIKAAQITQSGITLHDLESYYSENPTFNGLMQQTPAQVALTTRSVGPEPAAGLRDISEVGEEAEYFLQPALVHHATWDHSVSHDKSHSHDQGWLAKLGFRRG